MRSHQPIRRLAALMFTDIAGYSRMTEKNEQGTHELLTEHNRIIREVLPQFGGREIRTIGDAFFIEFPSAVDAAECAYRIQSRLYEWNMTLPQERRLLVRIGLHLGDILDAGDDNFGNEVNVSARLESLARPGGICISQQILDQIRGKVDLEFEPMGRAQLKNIREGVSIYSVKLPWQKASGRRTKILWSQIKPLLSQVPKSWFRSPIAASRTLVAAFIFGVGLGFVPPIYQSFLSSMQPDSFQAGYRGPAGIPAPQPMDDDWKILLKPPGLETTGNPGSEWMDFVPAKAWQLSDEVKGEYWLKKEFSVNAKYRDPALVLGNIQDRHRVYFDGVLIGGNEYEHPVTLYTLDPKLLEIGKTHTILIKAYTKWTVIPGLNIVPRIGAYLGDMTQIAPLVRNELIVFHMLRTAYFAVTAAFFVGFMLYFLFNRLGRRFLYYGLYSALGLMLLLYQNRMVMEYLDHHLQFLVKLFSIALGPLVLSSAYFTGIGIEKAERRNNWGILLFGLAMVAALLPGEISPRSLIDRSNVFHICSAVYSFSIFFYLATKLVARIRAPSEFKNLDAGTLFFLAVNGGLNLLSLRGNYSLPIHPALKSFTVQLLVVYPALFMISMFTMALLDYSSMTRTLRFRKDTDALKLEIARLLGLPGDPASQLASIHSRICQFLEVSQSTLYVRQGSALRACNRLAGPGSMSRIRDQISMEEGVIGHSVRTHNPMLVRNIKSDLRFKKMIRERPEPEPSYSSNSFMIFPLLWAGEVIGALTFTEKKKGTEFVQEDFELVQSLVSDVTLLVELNRARGNTPSPVREEPAAQPPRAA